MCRFIGWAFGILYLVAFALFIVGTFGLFGSERGPLAGIFLVPLGLPWNLGVELVPEPGWPWLAAAAPLVNLLFIWGICRRFRADR